MEYVYLMVFNATFNNISVISWRSVLLVEETGGPGENHRPVASHWQTLSYNVVHLALIELTTWVVIGTDCIDSCKSNYHKFTAIWNLWKSRVCSVSCRISVNIMIGPKCLTNIKRWPVLILNIIAIFSPKLLGSKLKFRYIQRDISEWPDYKWLIILFI